MQQASAESGLQGGQAQGSGSSQSLRSGGDPRQSTRAASGRPKKRERNEPAPDPSKQQRTDKGQRNIDERDGFLKPEASSLVGEDGGLCSVASVDGLVSIMQYEWNDCVQRPVDLIVSRTMLAKVVAATVEHECLYRFLKLGGLSILDRWLQEAHRGRLVTNIDIVEDGEKAVEDLLLALIGALERLPVDLVALKTCSVGKSVNYFRSHKHPDIQRRVRKLVDTWKKRVESELKQPGEVRLSTDPGLCLQQLDVGMTASNSQEASYMEHPAPVEYSCLGRGKFASVASLCSSPDSQSKASFTVLSSLAPVCSVDASNEALLKANVPTKPSNVSFKQDPDSKHPLNAYTQISEDGRVKSTTDLSHNSTYVPGSCDQARVGKSTGANRPRKSNNVNSNTSSGATALSASVLVSKDHIETSSISGTRQQPYGASFPSVAEVCTLPCCSSSLKNSDKSQIYDAFSRSTMNSASSCVADLKERTTFAMKYSQSLTGSEPAKAGIQLLATIAASESSMVIKSPDSPSDKSVSMQRANTLKKDNNNPLEAVMHQSSPKAVDRLYDREHYDHNSSTVSSPSETSTHVDIRMCESRRALAVYVNASSPVDTTSETSLPSLVGKDPSRDGGACTSGSLREQGKVPALSEKNKRFCLRSALVAEAVGESSVVDRAESKNSVNLTPKIVLENDALEEARQVAVEVEQEVVNCQGGASKTEIFNRSSVPHGDVAVGSRSTCSSAMVDFKQDLPRNFSFSSDAGFPAMNGERNISSLRTNACSADERRTHGSEVTASARREEIERPIFDLNEMLSGEDGPVQVCPSGRITNALGPIQDCSLPASVSKPALPIMPMAPIAVVAAANGSFTLPAVSCRPTGGELGWRGSAATSAFRPTQPRRNLEKNSLNVPEQSPPVKTFLDFDLNMLADSSTVDDDKIANDNMALKSSFLAVKVDGNPATSPTVASFGLPNKGREHLRAAWDLNQVDDGATESHSRLDFDLNSGPMLQDNDDVVLSGKHIRMQDPSTSATTSTGIASRLPPQSLSPVTPIIMPAYAMPNSDIPYSGGSATPWVNSGPHDGLMQYNVFMQSQSGFPPSGMTCSPLPTMAAGPYGGIPFGFSSASMQGFSVPYVDTLRTPPLAAVSPPFASNEPLMPSQIKSPCMMGVLTDVSHQQGNGGFWSRPNLDLNAGPEGVDANYVKDDRRHMFVINEQMRARHQVVDLATLLQQREQEGCVGMSGSMQGALSKHPAWR
eukprot:c24188_g1_i2 orf=471-4184(+)